jgi:amino acid transporter
MILASGYYLFLDGGWDIIYFFLTYSMIFFFLVVAVSWKVLKSTTYIKPGTADLHLGDLKREIDSYELTYTSRGRGIAGSFFDRLFE